MFRLTLLALPLLVACTAALPPREVATLPRDAVMGAGDPARTAVITANSIFAQRSPAMGQPAAAARAIAQMEFLAVDLPQNNAFSNASPNLETELSSARAEWRGVLDIAHGTPAQPVINALFAASRALEAGQPEAAAAALPPAIFRKGGSATLTQLAVLPRLPRTATAAATAQQALRTAGPTSSTL